MSRFNWWNVKLDLMSTGIGDTTVELLAKIVSSPGNNLEFLHIQRNQPADAAFKALAEALECVITKLFHRGNGMGENGGDVTGVSVPTRKAVEAALKGSQARAKERAATHTEL